MKWQAFSPSNLALIKYMGKQSNPENKLELKNLPLNPSLSYTLNHFITWVEIEESQSSLDQWLPFDPPPFYFKDQHICDRKGNKLYFASQDFNLKTHLPQKDQDKFLDFFQVLKKIFSISGFYTIRSANNFPLSAGVASSASSFSALTLATYHLAQACSSQKNFIKSLTSSCLSQISRLGSGSSCRSFFSPWAFWQDQGAHFYDCFFQDLIHQLIVVEREEKKTSSREAHRLILTSPFFKDRAKRAQERYQQLNKHLKSKNWKQCFEICSTEFKDMHHLFETSQPSFLYKTSQSEEVLNKVDQFWQKNQDGPLVTMDAGANVHLLYRRDQKNQAQDMLEQFSQELVLFSEILE